MVFTSRFRRPSSRLAGTLCIVFLAVCATARAEDVLPSRVLVLPEAMVPENVPISFDLVDVRQERVDTSKIDVPPHSRFDIKRHLGAGAGYDDGLVHGSIGLYLTIAEWGRWNFGIPAVALGLTRYPVYNRTAGQSYEKDEWTLMLSMASVHYRVGYVRSWGVYWYINLESVYDVRFNHAGSQIGLSFSRK